MHIYEIRILRKDGEPELVSQEMHLSVHAAIRSARKQASGRRCEIWRDGERLYRTPVRLTAAQRAMALPAEENWLKAIHHSKAQQNIHSLVAAVNALPLAVVLYDQKGDILCHSGAAQRVLGHVIPAHDDDQRLRWQLWDSAGNEVGPRDWPGTCALRGEYRMEGFEGVYRYPDGRARRLHITAMPLSDGRGFEGGVSILQDMDPAMRFAEGMQGALAPRFVQTFFDSMEKLAYASTSGNIEKMLRDLDRTLGLFR